MLTALFHARSGTAQTNDAISRQLFEQGRQLAANKQYAEACPKFEDAYRLHPGIGILLNLADCWEHMNRTASAWAAYMRVVDDAHRNQQSDREGIARARAAALEQRLSRLLIRVESKDEGLEITRDGEPVGAAQWGVALPVDPGQHVIEARAPAKIASRAVVDVPLEANVAEVVIPALLNAPTAGASPVITSAPAAAAPSPTSMPQNPTASTSVAPASAPPAANAAVPSNPPVLAPADPNPARPDMDAKSSSNSQTTIGWIVGGAGVVGLAAGTIFAVQVSSKNNDADTVCPKSVNCTSADKQRYESAISDAKSARDLSVLGFALGGAAVATGTILILTAPRTDSTALRINPAVDVNGRLSVSLNGVF
jgi:serine/threonine-protein kinase